MSRGILGFCLSCGDVEEPVLPAPAQTGSGSVIEVIVSPLQARIAALQGTGSIQSKLQGAYAASPIGARVQSLTGGPGTATDASHYHDFAPTGVPYRDIVGGPNRGFLGHF